MRVWRAHKRFLLAGVCCAGMIMGAMPAALAQKAAGGLIQPSGGWAVSRIDNSKTQGGSYCTLARQYANNVIFSIGRNEAEEYSLAIDFQDAKLKTDKAYDIALKAGNQTREVQLMPASPRAMVVRLGWDDSFFEAMEKAQAFSVTLDKEAYGFALPDYASGKADLMQCMESLKTAAPSTGTDVLAAESGIGAAGFAAKKMGDGSAPVKADPAKRPDKTIISSLETPEVPGLAAQDKAAYVAPQRSTDMESLKAHNAQLQEALVQQRKDYETRLAAQGDQTNQLAELREKLRLAEMKGGSGAPTIAAGTAAAAAPSVRVQEVVRPDPAQAKKIADLEQQVASLNQQLAAKPTADPADTQKIATLEGQVASLQKQLAERTSPEIKAAPTPLPNPEQAKRIADLQNEVNELKAAQKAPATSLPQDRAKIAELEKAQETYIARITDLQKQVGALQQAGGQASPAGAGAAATAAPNAETQKLNAEIATLKSALKQRNQDIADLEGQMQTLAAHSRAAPPPVSAQTKMPGSDKEAATLRAELEKKDKLIQAAQQRTAGDQQEIAKLRQQVAQLQTQTRAGGQDAVAAQRLQRDNAQLRSRMAQQQETFEKKMAAVDQRATVTTAPVPSVDTAAGGAGLKTLLGRAGISATKDNARPGGVVDAYRWQQAGVIGRAQAIEGGGNARNVSQIYTDTQRNACTGDFASIPGAAADGRVVVDIACVDDAGGRAQSLLFTQQGNQVIALILETDAQDMDRAMDLRDKLGGQL